MLIESDLWSTTVILVPTGWASSLPHGNSHYADVAKVNLHTVVATSAVSTHYNSMSGGLNLCYGGHIFHIIHRNPLLRAWSGLHNLIAKRLSTSFWRVAGSETLYCKGQWAVFRTSRFSPLWAADCSKVMSLLLPALLLCSRTFVCSQQCPADSRADMCSSGNLRRELFICSEYDLFSALLKLNHKIIWKFPFPKYLHLNPNISMPYSIHDSFLCLFDRGRKGGNVFGVISQFILKVFKGQ